MSAPKTKSPILSIIILSYNTKDLLADCLDSLAKLKKELDFEVLVPDNGSTDGSIDLVRKKYTWATLIDNQANLGFAKGNNSARKYTRGKYVLFLNSDTIVYPGTLKKSVDLLESNEQIGAMTCRLKMADGGDDPDARRSFPTPWVSLTHLVLKLDKLFPQSKLFARYWYGYISPSTQHEVDVIQGAYFMSPKKVLDSVDWFDEDYFLDGEDIDLCWKIHEKGFKIYYYPKVHILHLKGASKGKHKKTKSKVPLAAKLKFRMAGVNSMEIFYRKRMWHKYPFVVNLMVLAGIRIMKGVRILKVAILG